ncbi:MAG: hypothetical protein WKF87_19460 [Chryseolinea sp.]
MDRRKFITAGSLGAVSLTSNPLNTKAIINTKNENRVDSITNGNSGRTMPGLPFQSRFSLRAEGNQSQALQDSSQNPLKRGILISRLILTLIMVYRKEYPDFSICSTNME